jgi:hypothetical protein
MKTTAQASFFSSFGAWLQNAKATFRREATRALELHFQYCETVAKSRRRM